MQWNVNELNNWEEMRSFVDTALLPIYLYRADLEVSDHVWRMNYLLNVAAGIEQKLRGRILLYPVNYHFAEEQQTQQIPAGFSHYVLLHFRNEPIRVQEQDQKENLLTLSIGEEDLKSSLRFEVTVDVLYKEIIRHWQQRTAQ